MAFQSIEDMHINVKVELDKTSSLELPSFETEEIDYWLNQAIETIIDHCYSGFNRTQTGFEETQKRIDDLGTLITNPVTISPSVSSTYLYEFDLPSDYLYDVLTEAQINFVDNNGNSVTKTVPCNTTKSDSLSIKRRRDPFSEHNLYLDEAQPLKTVRDSDIVITTDGNYTVTSLYLTYIKEPTVVNYTASTDCDLPDHVHSRVVKTAVNKMLENIESQRYISHSAELSKIEQ